MSATPPHVCVLSTGGTIAGKGASSTSLTEYDASQLLGSELIAGVPEASRYAQLTTEQIVNVSSPNITTAVWVKLAERINGMFSKDAHLAGVVVTHGTSTLEETAYFLHLTVHDQRPVVLVGSQRPSTAISADGPLNLLNAIRTAAAPDARGKGVMIVMNDEINGARDVTKSNTYRVETFRSGELGFLGYVDADKVSFYKASTRRHTFDSEFSVSEGVQLPRVEIVSSYAECSTTPLRALAREGVEGIVFASPGAGSLSDAEVEVIRELNASTGKKPVFIRSSRTGNGRVTGRHRFDALGIVPADNLSPQKARILLMLALTKTRDRKEIARIFSEY